MTLDELLEAVSPEEKVAITDICEAAGTSEADWKILKHAGSMLAQERKMTEIYRNGWSSAQKANSRSE